ncbi:arginine--tRNA ligase [Erysipelothrix urinaevulpis]|uniref:arginine--tRNA ligase n=1 Tax=Erysipelothrix urinaevulpis TaxID=2683717 RepID=UPI00135CA5AF|nr:arginine--tRNA ligase [Erysipelothrix urinaevulpis]
MSLLEKINVIVSVCFAEAGYPNHGQVTESKRPDLCQFQSNDSFVIAKEEKINPKIVCERVIEILERNPHLKNVTFAPPGFINIDVTDEFLLDSLSEMMASKTLGIKQIGVGQSIIMDYGGPNVAKPLHVGHVRSVVIGEAMKRIARTSGYDVIGDIHLGDWGLPIGLVILELQTRNPEWACFSDDFEETNHLTIEVYPEDLYEIYPYASAKSKEDDQYLKDARLITARLQEGHQGYRFLWKKIISASKQDIKKDYDKLDVEFDYWYGESDADVYIPQLMEILKQKDLIRESEGALVVDILTDEDKSPMPPVIVEKSDGSSIYATTDLATIIQRERDFTPDKYWYVVDKRQGLHFEQVFRVARKANLVSEDTDFNFLGFGTMNGPDGKPFKTRDGGVMSLSSLLQLVQDKSFKTLALTQKNPSELDALKIGTAAIKFGDLINHPSLDYVFDIEKFLSFEGKTGSYILYNNVRILAILEKMNVNKQLVVSEIVNQYDRNLILRLLKNPEVFNTAVTQQSPNVVAESTYQISVAFAKFYAENNIAKEKDRNRQASWLGLMQATTKILTFNLDKLGIQTVEKM